MVGSSHGIEHSDYPSEGTPRQSRICHQRRQRSRRRIYQIALGVSGSTPQRRSPVSVFRDGVRHPLRQGAVRRRCGKQLPDLVERKAESLVSPDTPQGSYLIAAVEAIAGVGARGRLQQVDASQWCRARTVSPDNAAASLTLYMFPPVSIRCRRQVNRL